MRNTTPKDTSHFLIQEETLSENTESTQEGKILK